MKHTPGPWSYTIVGYTGFSDNNPICAIEPNICEGAFLEDARLIAAAPELLEHLKMQRCPACKGLLGEPKQNPELDCYCDEARAVIAKATGETK